MIARILILTSTVICFPISTPAEVIYQNDFSGGNNLGTIRTTSGDNPFHSAWSITSSLQSELGNQFARFSIDIPVAPTNPNARWSGGCFTRVSPALALPEQWQLSFDLSLTVAEPVQVSFRFAFPPSSLPPQPGTMTYWIESAAAGWQHIVVNQDTPFTLGEPFYGTKTGTYLSVGLASHDPSGNPLSIAQIGSHSFSLDNIILETIPEPTGIVWIGLVIIGLMRNKNRTA